MFHLRTLVAKRARSGGIDALWVLFCHLLIANRPLPPPLAARTENGNTVDAEAIICAALSAAKSTPVRDIARMSAMALATTWFQIA